MNILIKIYDDRSMPKADAFLTQLCDDYKFSYRLAEGCSTPNFNSKLLRNSRFNPTPPLSHDHTTSKAASFDLVWLLQEVTWWVGPTLKLTLGEDCFVAWRSPHLSAGSDLGSVHELPTWMQTDKRASVRMLEERITCFPEGRVASLPSLSLSVR